MVGVFELVVDVLPSRLLVDCRNGATCAVRMPSNDDGSATGGPMIGNQLPEVNGTNDGRGHGGMSERRGAMERHAGRRHALLLITSALIVAACSGSGGTAADQGAVGAFFSVAYSVASGRLTRTPSLRAPARPWD
jgi:hypothetical protein